MIPAHAQKDPSESMDLLLDPSREEDRVRGEDMARRLREFEGGSTKTYR